MDMVRKQELNLLSRDAMTELNRHLGTQNRKVWLLYDDLDMDIKEDSPWQQDALGGLMRLIYDLHNLDLHQIRFKVFLREDIWSTLVFTNKSHFGEARTLLLQWGIEDFLRLAHRMATGGSQEFRTLSYRTLPLTEKDLDEASEETLRKALAPLWGLHQETGKKAYAARWVYSRMTDASQNTYPRSLTILLREARESELRREKRSVKVPRDRLLRPASLRDGLIKASRERCDAIKNEYPRLQAFFANMNELRSAFRDEELRQLWQRTAADTFDSFDAFVKRLETIGILAEKWSKKSKYQYGIANLYLDGFEVKRVRGQTK
ncbi:MAG: hypothetical protein GY835_02745 [bacterium]|nr:hypothetical protein [bacterium]